MKTARETYTTVDGRKTYYCYYLVYNIRTIILFLLYLDCGMQRTDDLDRLFAC